MIRAHKRVVMGDLVPSWPWSYLPHAARLYCRKSYPPIGETFRTKNALGVELLRQVNTDSEGCFLAVCDDAYAAATVGGACLESGPTSKSDCDAAARTPGRMYHPVADLSGENCCEWGEIGGLDYADFSCDGYKL